MKIATICLAKGFGGLEQVFLDYGRALEGRGHSVGWVTRPGSALAGKLAGAAQQAQISQISQYDPIAPMRLRALLKRWQPDVLIAQGQRGIVIARKAARGLLPVIGVNHGHTVERSIGLDAVIAISAQMRDYYRKGGQDEGRIFDLPNMIALPPGGKPAGRGFHDPPVIGSMGRLCMEKSFHIYLDTLAELRRRGMAFKAILGGDGALRAELEAQAARLDLDDVLDFAGWIDADAKARFWRANDIFCFTSHDDTAPLTLLEAPLEGVPLVMTTPPGPRDMHVHDHTAICCAIDDVQALADGLQALITRPDKARQLANAAYDHIATRHGMPHAAEKLDGIVQQVLTRWQRDH